MSGQDGSPQEQADTGGAPPGGGRSRLRVLLGVGALALLMLGGAIWLRSNRPASGEAVAEPPEEGAVAVTEGEDDEALAPVGSLLPPGEGAEPTIAALVLHDGTDPGGASDLAQRGLKLASERIRIETIAEAIPPGRAVLLGPGSVSTCHEETTTNLRVQKDLAVARRQLLAGELPAARAGLARADAQLVCISEPIAAEVAFEVFLLQGVEALRLADEETARARFRQARIVDPNAPWDRELGPEGAALFASALDGAAPEAMVTLLPAHRGGIRFTGMDLSMPKFAVPFPPGTHLLQARGLWSTPIRLEAEPGSATLIVPDWLPWNAVSWVSSTENNPELGLVLASVLPPEPPVYVVQAGRLWRLDPEAHRFEPLAP